MENDNVKNNAGINEDRENNVDLNFQKNMYNYNLRKAKIFTSIFFPAAVIIILVGLYTYFF